MKYYYFLFVFVASALSAHAYQPKIEIIEQFDNLKMVAFISKEDLQNNPEWNPDSEAPPLTVSQAIQAYKSYTKSQKALKPIKEIEIRSVPNYKNHWHYLFKVPNQSMKTGYNIYVVLMNGKVIPAIIEPQSYK